MINDFVLKLMQSFPKSFVNGHGEFIAHEKANEYFGLTGCKDELEVKCKVIEWFSRGAYKSWPFNTTKKNKEFHQFMRDGINSFLETNFTDENMELIYTKLGNQVNRKLTITFINSEYNMDVLQ